MKDLKGPTRPNKALYNVFPKKKDLLQNTIKMKKRAYSKGSSYFKNLRKQLKSRYIENIKKYESILNSNTVKITANSNRNKLDMRSFTNSGKELNISI